jgi:hypothetical protein
MVELIVNAFAGVAPPAMKINSFAATEPAMLLPVIVAAPAVLSNNNPPICVPLVFVSVNAPPNVIVCPPPTTRTVFAATAPVVVKFAVFT